MELLKSYLGKNLDEAAIQNRLSQFGYTHIGTNTYRNYENKHTLLFSTDIHRTIIRVSAYHDDRRSVLETDFLPISPDVLTALLNKKIDDVKRGLRGFGYEEEGEPLKSYLGATVTFCRESDRIVAKCHRNTAKVIHLFDELAPQS